MNEKRMAAARAEIRQRVATFRKIQIRFERDRNEYYEETLARALGDPPGPAQRERGGRREKHSPAA